MGVKLTPEGAGRGRNGGDREGRKERRRSQRDYSHYDHQGIKTLFDDSKDSK